MTVLFVARHFTYFRNFESVIRLLAERGHRVHVVAERDEALGGRRLVDRLAAELPRITVGNVPARADARWFAIATVLRRSLDFLRYDAPIYDDTPKLRERAWDRTPQLALSLARLPGRRVVENALDAMDRAIPTDAAIDAFIDEQAPDLVLLTPLIELGSPQLDLLKSARARRIPTALAVWSWDHLTSKARIRQAPDRVLVWNATQKQEAMALHGVADERIVVTGAQCFDQWFDRRPSRSRDAFCCDMGLPGDRPLVLYVCSALFRGGPSEAEFVAQWVAAVRGAQDTLVRNAAILVRPHPQRMYEWDDVAVPEGVAFHGWHPIDQAGRNDYFDALYHASAVVGLNTSAMIEAAVVDRPVLTVLPPEFRGSQEGTLHFHYLLDGDTAVLHAARSLDAHLRDLSDALAGRAESRNRTFVRHFIRPAGMDVPATPAFVDALELTARLRPGAAGDGVAVAWTPLLRLWHANTHRPSLAALMMEAAHVVEERDRARRLEDKRTVVRVRDERRRHRAAEKDERYRVKRRKRRVAHLKTMVRRVLLSGRGAGSHS